ncbi:MAG: ATP-binding cassette domain-containing protein, partial [Oscillospiraceae bacterium]|jgi:lincosamide and streptogramin A transport system ATP-binding/permease protein|nr:ATP-binding cassette domain-containing protein [Oscillospiraceae bacterium]
LKLLLGEYAYGGTITSPVSFSYFPFDVADKSMNTLDIIDTMNPDYEYWELCRELNLLQVPEDVLFRPFETLSNGEQTKTLIAALFLKKNNFLLLDEPTNHLDFLGKENITRYLKSKKGFLLVSHDRTLLDETVDHILSINRTDIEIQKGNFSQWLENKRRQDESELEQNRKLKKDIVKLTAAARRTAGWSDKLEGTKIGTHAPDRGAIGHKAAKMMKRAKSLESRQNTAIEEKSKLLRNIELSDTLKLSPLRYHAGVLAQLCDVGIAYGARKILGAMDLTVSQGERIALKGKNGSGKSSLIKLLAGEDIPHTGQVKLGSGLVISYVAQDTADLSGALPDYARAYDIDLPLFLAILRKMGFERVQFDKDIEELSEGQKKKVLIARSLSQQAHLYIWDEPLNYIDIQSRLQVEELITQYTPSMLFVEHDDMFVRNIATREVTLAGE